ncbi:hypothetical protein Hamer_G007754 [Homarus americanus]|uniref:Uncharacterized protein n=1 Tax=Homarus americanus TaxID=6706 RepID=A0A8J5JRX1_HOMAM|nr:hypothetical protein Hamer_G007754 [Homarus americanus]
MPLVIYVKSGTGHKRHDVITNGLPHQTTLPTTPQRDLPSLLHLIESFLAPKHQHDSFPHSYTSPLESELPTTTTETSPPLPHHHFPTTTNTYPPPQTATLEPPLPLPRSLPTPRTCTGTSPPPPQTLPRHHHYKHFPATTTSLPHSSTVTNWWH